VVIRRLVFLAVAGALFAVLVATNPRARLPVACAQVAGELTVSVFAAWALTGVFAPRRTNGRDDL
jgi:hypothetical protein